MFYLKLFKTYFAMHIKKLISFRGSFIIQFFAQGLNYAATFVLMYVMISAFGDLNGWTSYEVMLLYALSLLSYGFAGMFFYFFNFFTTREIYDGSFDDALVKPVHLLPYLIFKSITPGYITHLLLSIIVLILCIVRISVALTVFNVLWLAIIVLCGTLIFGGMFLLITAPAFLITQTDALSQMLFFFRESGYYPTSIFPRFIQVIMTFIMPYSMMNFFPVQIVLGKSDLMGFGTAMPWLAPVFSVIFFAIGVLVFCCLSKKYKSTGS